MPNILNPLTNRLVEVPISEDARSRFKLCIDCGERLAIFESSRCWQCGNKEREFHFQDQVFWNRLECYEGAFNNFCFDDLVFDFRRGKKQIFKRKVFRGCRFVNAQFLHVDFDGCVFEKDVDFTGATFEKCSFREATFKECAINFAKFHRTNFTGSKLSSMKIGDSLFKAKSSLSQCIFSGVQLQGSTFKKCSFRNVRFDSDSNITQSPFSDSDFRWSELSHMSISYSTFSGKTILSSCNFENTKFEKVTIEGREVDLIGTNLKNTKFIESDLSGCNLVRAKLNDLCFDNETKLGNVVVTQRQFNQLNLVTDQSLIIIQETISPLENILLWNMRYSVAKAIALCFDFILVGSIVSIVCCFLTGVVQTELFARRFFMTLGIILIVLLVLLLISTIGTQKIRHKRLG